MSVDAYVSISGDLFDYLVFVEVLIGLDGGICVAGGFVDYG